MDFEAPKSRWWWMLVVLLSGLALGCRKDTAAGAALREATPPETQSDSREAASREGPHPSQRLAGVSPVPIKLVARQISAVAMGGDSQRALHGDPWSLFDGDATKAFGTEGQPVRARVKLAEKGVLDGMTVYGRAEGSLSVLAEAGSELATWSRISTRGRRRKIQSARVAPQMQSGTNEKDGAFTFYDWRSDRPVVLRITQRIPLRRRPIGRDDDSRSRRRRRAHDTRGDPPRHRATRGWLKLRNPATRRAPWSMGSRSP